MSRAGRRALQWAGVLWTLPNTVLGLLLGGLGLLCGARLVWQRRQWALVFLDFPVGRGALVLGNVIACAGSSLHVPCQTYATLAGCTVDASITLADHERAHVFQYMLLGPFFLPLYALCGGISWRNRFERAADRYALSGRDWWPWS